MPRRQAVHGDVVDISTPLPKHVVGAIDAAAAADSPTTRERSASPGVATYELALGRGADSATQIVEGLPPAELGEVIFHQGNFWRVDAIEPATSREVDGRLIVSRTTNVETARVH